MFKLFKNASIFRITRELESLTAPALSQHLPDYPFTHCTSQESARTGWVMNDDNTPALFHFNNFILITLRTEHRDVPKPAIGSELKRLVDAWEQRNGTLPNRPEKAALRDEAYQALLPRAFAKSSYTQLLIDTQRQLIMVDTASARVAENALALLRKTVQSLPVYPVAAKVPPELTMTEWMKGPASDIPAGILPQDDRLTLENTFEPSKKASFNGFGGCDAARELMSANNVITSLSLELETPFKLGMVLTQEVRFTRLLWADALKEQALNDGKEEAGEDDEALKQLVNKTTFILMANELAQAWDLVIAGLGGEPTWKEPEPEQATSEQEA